MILEYEERLQIFKAHYTGHFYFTLKDETSTIKCVMFKGYASTVKFKPADGMKVVIDGQVSVFERDGAYQIYCKTMSPEGLGELYLAYEQLKEKLKKEGKSKAEIGREAFLKETWAWKEKYGGEITSQLRRLGCSCDWSRERFTMDEGLSEAVKQVFINLYNEGLIYKGKRMINWCPICNTSISDAEVEYEEQAGHLWHIQYPVLNDDGTESGEYLTFATTRPETMLGDTAVAIHPDDARYAHLKGRKVMLPLMNREIPVVEDTYVDMEFGTGVVKITPAHDPNDLR